MAHLKDVIAYLLKEYPFADELSNARVCKMIYLADWRHAIRQGKTITNINWYFDNFGPYVEDVKQVVQDNPELFSLESTSTIYGDPKTLFSLKNSEYEPRLADEEVKTLDYVISKTKPLNWSEFIKLVYSTYPIQSSERYQNLNLPTLAAEYRKQ